MQPKYYILSINNRPNKYTKKVYEVYGELIGWMFLRDSTWLLLDYTLLSLCNREGKEIIL